MAEHEKVLEDAMRVRRLNPARKLYVPAFLIDEEVEHFLAPFAKSAQQNDGCVTYLVIGGRTFRVTLERLC